MAEDLDARLADLEVKFAFQTDTIDSLNEMVTKQWDEIERLRLEIERLKGELAALEEGQGEPEDTRPPHY